MTKTALITGGSRGIGAATVDLLRARGWDVIAPQRHKFNMNWWEGALKYALELKRQCGNIDALIFCHGQWYSEKIQSHEEWQGVYSSRVSTPAMLTKVMLHDTINSGGCVVMVSSTRGFIGGVDTGPYAAACAAQIALMQGYAREYQGVRFNCVCPGLTDTDMGQQVIATGGAKPGAAMQPPGVVAAEIVRLIESQDNGRVMRVVGGEVAEAKWEW